MLTYRLKTRKAISKYKYLVMASCDKNCYQLLHKADKASLLYTCCCNPYQKMNIYFCSMNQSTFADTCSKKKIFNLFQS